ncbi:cytochrome b [Burkholderia cenocepacia]|uniref:cytochrome b n=1 Tax=Burkholderia cenocepacia TaxID=95486 RepID=UPI000F5A0FAB|nr:cytochrome b [Burkholderia cenocepacia]RQU48884.1 cytochrome b [Burkholderia cenocepacia]RQV31769.1 cytochrome b [Burkholderia cenocepacia]
MNDATLDEQSTIRRYSHALIYLHWAIFILVVLAYVAVDVRGPKGSASRGFWMSIHLWAGVLTLTLATSRLVLRMRTNVPTVSDAGPLLQALGRMTHIALYLFILLQPVLGILMINLSGKPVVLAGVGWSFAVVGPHAEWRSVVKSAHEWLGFVFYFVIGLHVLAALWHQFILKDGLLDRMRP